MSELVDLHETGRRLGHDLYRHCRLADQDALPMALLEGIADARGRGVSRVGADRYVAKWLQLRVNAYRRGRIVDERVTPDFLRQIDVATCPVTRVALTHGALAETDWSIDRLNNDGAYVPHNLAVMSTAANRAKGHRSFDEVLRLSQSTRETAGLSPVEWLRLASLMLGPCFAEHAHRAPLIPLAAPIPGRTVRPAAQLIQFVFTQGAAPQSGRNRLVRQFKATCRNEAARVRLDRFAEAMHVALKQSSPCWDAWLRPEVLSAFVAWRNALDTRSWAEAGEVARGIAGGRPVPTSSLRSWHLDQRGYGH